MPQKRSLIQRPPTEGLPQVTLPKGESQRPLGKDIKLDIFDALTSLLGAGGGVEDPDASTAAVLGGLLGLGGVMTAAKGGKGAQAATKTDNLHSVLDDALGGVMNRPPQRRKLDQARVQEAYNAWLAEQGMPAMEITPTPSQVPIRKPKPVVGDDDARKWGMAILETAMKHGYQPTGQELSEIFEFARVIKQPQRRGAVTPAEFAVSYRNTLPNRSPLRQAMKADTFFPAYNEATGAKGKLLGKGTVGRSEKLAATKQAERARAELPAEFQGTPEEQAAYNTVREGRVRLRTPPATGEGPIPVRRPRDPRASGELPATPAGPGGDPDARTDMSRLMPEYRDKYGMALDVLEDLKRSPSADRYGNVDVMRSAPMTSMVDDPVRYIGTMRTHDGQAGMPPMGSEGEMKINMLLQDLANYFTSPRFDPFGPASHPPPRPTPGYDMVNKTLSKPSKWDSVPGTQLRDGLDWDGFMNYLTQQRIDQDTFGDLPIEERDKLIRRFRRISEGGE